MSFKSKQRAKHGHLFGDGTYVDPLNATLVSASEDPLFSPSIKNKAQSQSSRTNSPTPNDPLSRPTDTSSSTPLSPRRGGAITANATKSPSSSIFGDIDVSKLGTSNGRKHTVRSPALRNTQYDLEDEEDLFGGAKRTRKPSKPTTPPSPSVKSATILNQDIPSSRKANVSPPMPAPASPIIQQKPTIVEPKKPIIEKPAEQPPPPQQHQQQQRKEPVKNETPVTREEKPIVSSSSSSSFFRFFKSSNSNSNANSKNSSSASSVASVNAPSPIVKSNDAVNSLPPQSPPVPHQVLPPSPLQQHQRLNKANHIKPTVIQSQQQQQQEDEEDEEPEEPEEQFPAIEDEATRAFAEDNGISFKPTLLNYRSISPELTMDALKIDTRIVNNVTHKKLLPSISTPTHNIEDPWSNPVIQPTVEPSISSPLVVKVQDIEPQKRTAFADLINSWNTGKSNNEEYPSQDPKEFFEHVAAEQRDFGFAGIRDQDEDDQQKHYQSQQLDYQDEMNPWN
ncbi:hypothetical protein [Parasitella parasitica]|uniref:Uncharacterized protein n=1 Tax=Parasitella parasitica TaxID=35722 RepID=A0A0B7N0F1_9FUNG|nr:hypothetical protein [Parasitella parasitica]